MKKVHMFIVNSYDEESIKSFVDRVRDQIIGKLDGMVETCNEEIEVIVNVDKWENESI